MTINGIKTNNESKNETFAARNSFSIIEIIQAYNSNPEIMIPVQIDIISIRFD